MKITETKLGRPASFEPFSLRIDVETEADFHVLKTIAHAPHTVSNAVLAENAMGYCNRNNVTDAQIVAALSSLLDALKMTGDRGL